MKQWTGVVERKDARDWRGVKLHSFRLEGVDRWFKTAKDELPVDAGTEITFTERNGSVDLDSVLTVEESIEQSRLERLMKEDSVLEGRTAPELHTTRHAKENSMLAKQLGDAPPLPPPSGPTPWQLARADATRIIVAALEVEQTDNKGVLPWATNTAKSKKLDLLLGYINELTQQFIDEENKK